MKCTHRPQQGEQCPDPPRHVGLSAMLCSGDEEVSGLGSVLALGCLEAAAC